MKMMRLVMLVGTLSLTVPEWSEAIDACGRLYAHPTEPDCFTFAEFGPSESFEIENVGNFESWDIVHVTGRVIACEPSCRFGSDRCIIDNEISACEPDSLGRGVLQIRYNCWFWVSDSIGRWLTNRPEGFSNGDNVEVVGYLDPGCYNICQMGEEGCLILSGVSNCATPTLSSTWGRLKSLYVE